MASSSWALPISLSPPLNDREAVADALYRCVLGMDTNDATLFESAFTEDARLEFNGRVLDGLAAIRAEGIDHIGKLETTHFITNVRIHIADEGAAASMSASSLAQHYRAGTGTSGDAARLLTGAQYRLDLVKDNASSLWKIKVWKGQATWMEGDRAVVRGE